MNRPEDNQDRKQERRKKFSKPKSKNRDHYADDENNLKNIQKKETKRIKESFQDEEWEDWDRYYNH